MREKPISATEVGAQRGQTVYPEPFARQVAGRTKRKLGDVFGLSNFGINLTHLEPGTVSALFHYHMVQDEFVYILEGHPTIVFRDNEYELAPGDCMGFKAGTGVAHQLINRTQDIVTYIEVGDRTPGEHGGYPNDDLAFHFTPDGSPVLTHKDGTPF